jgi:hypothetical protein
MKSNTQVARPTNAGLSKGSKSASRKSKTAVKRGYRAARTTTDATPSTLSGYSASAQRFLKRGKSAFGGAYTWAGEAGKSLPANVRNFGLPDQKSIQTLMNDSPLVLGVVGLGIGVMLGAMLPAMATTKTTAAKSTRRK